MCVRLTAFVLFGVIISLNAMHLYMSKVHTGDINGIHCSRWYTESFASSKMRVYTLLPAECRVVSSVHPV